MSDVTIEVDGGDAVELAALSEFLKAQRHLKGRVRLQASGPVDGQLGSAFDVLAVAVGSGGAGVALADALKTWFSTRRTGPKIEIRITKPDGTETTIILSADTGPAEFAAAQQLIAAAQRD